MSHKRLKLNDPKLISTLKKYSNIELFSRREINLFHRKNINKLSPTETSTNNKKFSLNKSLSKFALETISSFDFLSTQTGPLSPKNKNIKSIMPYKTMMTECSSHNKCKNLKKNNKFFSTKDIKRHNNYIFSHYKKSEQRFNTISSSNPILCMKEKENKIELLKQIEMESKNNGKKINKKFIALMNYKQKKFKVKKYSMKDILNQTRNLMFCKIANNMKNEIFMRMEENYQNKMERIDDKLNAIKKGTNLHDIRFSNKLSEYVKYISFYKEKEKKKCDLIENNINEFKKEILFLQNKLKKEKLERDNILRWIYFQIKMKEKKLILPIYYKKIIETNLKRPLERRKTLGLKMQDLQMAKLSQKLHQINSSKNNELLESGHSSKNLIFLNIKNINNSSFKKQKSRPLNQKISSISNNLFNVHNNNKRNIRFDENNYLNNKNLEKIYQNLGDIDVDIEEINRITKYKLYLIYNTPEEFEDRLRQFENENIQLLNQYNLLQKYLNEEKREYITLLNEKAESDLININYIKGKEYELKEIIKRNEVLKNIIMDMKTGKYFRKKNNNIQNNNINSNKSKMKNYNINISSSSPFSVSKELYSRIEDLYNKCKSYDNTIKKTKKKKLINNKEEIISMLSYIECSIDKLKNKFRMYNRLDYRGHEMVKKIRNDIEKKHKIEKGEILRLQEKEKYLKFQEEIENKMNRIFFIQKRKTNVDNVLNSFGYNYNKNNFKREKNKGQPIFEDFMFENKDYFNFEK